MLKKRATKKKPKYSAAEFQREFRRELRARQSPRQCAVQLLKLARKGNAVAVRLLAQFQLSESQISFEPEEDSQAKYDLRKLSVLELRQVRWLLGKAGGEKPTEPFPLVDGPDEWDFRQWQRERREALEAAEAPHDRPI